MTKKKKTLRAAVLASIFAMAFSATAWADIWENGKIEDYTEYTPVKGGNNWAYQNDYYAYNPKLTHNSGDVSGGDYGTEDYDPEFNYYLQAYAYGTPNNNADELLVERIVGIKMNEGGHATQDLSAYGITDTINVSGVQFFHVEYDKDGNVVSPDGLNVADGKISLAVQINGEPSDEMHYCGESAKSISIGQLQRALEVIYNNDLELSQAFKNEAELRYNTDVAHNDRINTIALVKNEGTDGKYTFTNDDSVKTIIDINTYVKNNAGDAYYNYQEGSTSNTTIKQEITTLKNGWTVQVQGNEDQKNQITAGEVLNFARESNENNLKVELKTDSNGKSTVEFDFSETPTFTTVEATSSIQVGNTDKKIELNGTNGTIKTGEINIDGSQNKIIVGSGSNAVTIDGASGSVTVGKIQISGNQVDGSATITGLTNKEWDGKNIVSGRAATEDQLQKLQQNIEGDITTINQNIDTIQDNYVTNIQENNKDSLTGHSFTVTQFVNGSDSPETVTIQDYNTTYTVNKEKTESMSGNQKNIYRVTNNYGSSVGEAIIDTDTEYTVTIDNNGKSGNQVNIYRVKNSFDSFVGEAIIDTDTVTTMTEGNSNIHIENIGTNGDYNYKITLNKDLTNLDSVTSRIIIATESVTTPTLILGETNATTAITFDNTVNDGRITYVDSNEEVQQVANLNDGKAFAGDSGSAFVKLQDGVNIKGGANVQNLSDGNIGVIAEANNDGSATLNVKLSKDITGLNSVTSTTVNTEIINVSEVVNINNKTQITENGININNKVIVEENKVDVGGNKIENVAPGELSPDSQDAVNGSQLFNTNQKLDRLGNRVDKVGAGAAALAALHPLDFDPDDKLSFSAGVGNYGSETATALGAFYRPTEKVMFSAAGTMGNGENMVNLGVTFALDKTNNVSNSRVAMAREIQDLKSHIVKQDAQIAELIALVGQLTGKSIGQSEDSIMFPDVPENHWAYDYIEGLQKRGIVEGYPDGNFGGDRSMTRYEYAAMLYRALEKGFPVDSRLLDEFDAELGRIRIDRIKGLDDDDNKIERVRVNQYEDRDDYGSKLAAENEAE